MTFDKVWSKTDDRFGGSACLKVFKMGNVIWLQLLNQPTDFDQTWQLTVFSYHLGSRGALCTANTT